MKSTSRRCKNCRWWQRIDLSKDEICTNEDSEQRFEETHKDYGCFHWEHPLEQDGWVTWILSPSQYEETKKTAEKNTEMEFHGITFRESDNR